MALSFELTTLPPEALNMLRFLGRNKIDDADAEQLMRGTGQSERAFSKGIKRLSTKGYLSMDNARVYHLTPKGFKAIEEILEHDATSPQQTVVSNENGIGYDLCVVVLPGTLNTQTDNRLMLGLEPLPGEAIAGEATLLLRLNATGAEVSPNEFSATLSPDLTVAVAEFFVNPKASQSSVRLRVEVFQQVNYEEMDELGGMYIDLPINNAISRPRAFHNVFDLTQQFF